MFLVLVSMLLSCTQRNSETTYFYDTYTSDNTLFARNKLIIKTLAIDKLESRVIIEGQPGKYWIYEEFSEKYVENKGIYRRFEDSYNLFYRFDSVGTSLHINYLDKSSFFFNNIVFSDKKTYNIKGSKYKIYAYSEYEGSGGIVSYYLDKFGFIAYDLNNGNYLLCNRMSEYNEKIDNETLRIVNDSLIRDKCFFSIYRFSEKNPCLPAMPSNIFR